MISINVGPVINLDKINLPSSLSSSLFFLPPLLPRLIASIINPRRCCAHTRGEERRSSAISSANFLSSPLSRQTILSLSRLLHLFRARSLPSQGEYIYLGGRDAFVNLKKKKKKRFFYLDVQVLALRHSEVPLRSFG